MVNNSNNFEDRKMNDKYVKGMIGKIFNVQKLKNPPKKQRANPPKVLFSPNTVETIQVDDQINTENFTILQSFIKQQEFTQNDSSGQNTP